LHRRVLLVIFVAPGHVERLGKRGSGSHKRNGVLSLAAGSDSQQQEGKQTTNRARETPGEPVHGVAVLRSDLKNPS
jgi:hypothetical protein